MISEQTPETILWLMPGNQRNESMVNQASDLVKLVPWQCRNILITNAENFTRFSGETFKIKFQNVVTLAAKFRETVLTAYYEGLLDKADIIISSGMTGAIYSYVLKITNGMQFAQCPIIYASPKIPETTVAELLVDRSDEELFWWLVGTRPNFQVFIFGDEREFDIAYKRLYRVCPQTSKKIKQVVLMQYPGIQWSGDKVDKVVWSGRINSAKRPDIAAKIFSVLEGLGVKTEVYVVSHKAGAEASKYFNNVITGLGTDEYRRAAGSAKVLLITSELEDGRPLGYLELIERGVIPVIRKRPWMKTFLTTKWPLVFKTEGEAVEMCLDALTHYDFYAKVLDECVKEKYSAKPNFGEVLAEVWREHIAGDYMNEFSVNKNRKRIS